MRPQCANFYGWFRTPRGSGNSRGHANASLGEHEQAAEEFAKAIGPDLQLSYSPAECRAFALLGTSDLDAYREVCASLVEEFCDSDVPRTSVTSRGFAQLSPNPPAESKTVLNMARALHEYETTQDYGDKGFLTIGASLFRDGQYDAAVATLTTLADTLQRGGDTTDRHELACANSFSPLLVTNRDTAFRRVDFWPRPNATQAPIDKSARTGHRWSLSTPYSEKRRPL